MDSDLIKKDSKVMYVDMTLLDVIIINGGVPCRGWLKMVEDPDSGQIVSLEIEAEVTEGH